MKQDYMLQTESVEGESGDTIIYVQDCSKYKYEKQPDVEKQSGMERYNSALDIEDIQYILKNYKGYDKEYGSRPLAKKFNVSNRVILDLVNNKSYKRERKYIESK